MSLLTEKTNLAGSEGAHRATVDPASREAVVGLDPEVSEQTSETSTRTSCLSQFDQQASSEELTEQLPLASIGSGQPNADPFLAFLRRLFWPERLPTLQEGVMTAVDEVVGSVTVSTEPNRANPADVSSSYRPVRKLWDIVGIHSSETAKTQ